MWASPRTSTARPEQLEDRRDVDLGRLEQDLAERPPEPVVVERHVAQRPARERVAVRVQARRGQPDHRVARLDGGAVDDRVERDQPDGRAGQLDPGDDVADLGDLAARDLDPGPLGARAQADADRAADLRVGLTAEDEVEHRDRLGADADQVVDVHRDAVDPDRGEVAHALGDQHLGPDPVGAEGDPGSVVDPQHARVVARKRHHPRRLPGLDQLQAADQGLDRGVGRALADAGA